MIYPTKLGMAVIGIGFSLYLVSMQSFSGILFLILGILLGCFFLNALKAYRSCRHARILPPATISCIEGESLKDTWQIDNPKDFPIGHLEIICPWGALLRLGYLPPGETRHLSPGLSLPKRGIYTFNQLKIKSSFPYGLVNIQRRLQCPGEILVYPQVYPCKPPVAAGFEPMLGGRFPGSFKSTSGDHFHGVRPHQEHDPVKLIHWPSSSKGLGLMVKEFDEQLSGRVALVIAPSVYGSTPTTKNKSLTDWVARAAGSLAMSALDAGYQIEFICLPDRGVYSIPPFANGDMILEALARMPDTIKLITYAEWTNIVQQLASKASLNFVLTESTTEIDLMINKLLIEDKRKVIIYLPQTNEVQLLPLAKMVPIKYFDSQNIQ